MSWPGLCSWWEAQLDSDPQDSSSPREHLKVTLAPLDLRLQLNLFLPFGFTEILLEAPRFVESVLSPSTCMKPRGFPWWSSG